MRLSFASLAGLLSLASSATITLHITTTQSIPNPNALPPSTHATLSTFGQPVLSAPLSTSNTFVFRNVTSGSYLADIHCPTYAFAPLRVDVDESQADAVKVWETYRGNDWDNKGEAVPGPGGRFAVRVLGVKNYYMERSSCEFRPPHLLSMYLKGVDRLD
jgi:O-acetylhomoserine/O-acetylserine sulfhydrylase